MYEIQPEDAELLKHFRTTTTKNRPLKLNRLLNRLRMEPMAGKQVIVCTQPYSEYAIGTLGAGRGDPVELAPQRYAKLADAQWALLKIRWAIHSPYPWPADLD
ncbi:small subunit of N,N-dimethylformamidase [Achromobacter sp. SD115]|uniref:small subunit of N,N-dimethylformamidase n=1 Tax=unclassified Achromobacter TaxID=2626865 RepID=UPI001A95DCC2|nr:small subunit of N,N-dimethylformamidase [Achromobacter sp. SD115]MBO1012873.1 small subunit of N,N-dimethylformamidase [Achromobacter sp. SD115]